MFWKQAICDSGYGVFAHIKVYMIVMNVAFCYNNLIKFRGGQMNEEYDFNGNEYINKNWKI